VEEVGVIYFFKLSITGSYIVSVIGEGMSVQR